ncbi:sigma-70 family RNA polymerase sigma factor [soil metagenome]
MSEAFATRRRAHRLRPGTEAELRREYAEHGGNLFAMAYRALGDRGLAEEVVQETFVRAWRAADRFDAEKSSRKNWLFTIARNLIVDAARRRSKQPPPARTPGSEEDDEAIGRAEDTAEKAILAIEVEEALHRISDEHRHVILEVHYRGKPYSDIAREMGVPSGTLRSRMYYALKSLRQTLEEMGRSFQT